MHEMLISANVDLRDDQGLPAPLRTGLEVEDRGVELVADAVLRHEARLLLGRDVVAVGACGGFPVGDDLGLDAVELLGADTLLHLLEEELLYLLRRSLPAESAARIARELQVVKTPDGSS